MSNQEDEEQAQGLAQFHDKHSYQKLPDWLTTETETKDTGSKTVSYHIGKHIVELTEQGTLIIHESKTHVTLSADEAYQLLVLLHDNHRDTLRQLTQQTDEPKP